MHLKPVMASPSTDRTQPRYPKRTWRRPTWLRRSIHAAVTAFALSVAACVGPLDDEEPINYPGVVAVPYFSCHDEQPEYLERLYAPGVNHGSLCGEQTGWAAIQVDQPGIYRLSLSTGADVASVAVIDPEGEQVAQLDVDMPSVTMEMSPGPWIVAVTANDPVGNGWSSFNLSIETL